MEAPPAIIDLQDKYTITIKNLDLSGASGNCNDGMLGTIVTNGEFEAKKTALLERI